jgi:thioredoxin 1
MAINAFFFCSVIILLFLLFTRTWGIGLLYQVKTSCQAPSPLHQNIFLLRYSMITNLTDQNFQTQIEKSDKPVLVDFYASWCGPCQVLGPILEKIAEEFKDKVVLVKVNVDEFPQTSAKHGIDRIPNVFLFKNGKPVDGFLGLVPENTIKNWLKSALEK